MERPEQDARSRRRSAKRKEKTAHSGGGRKKIVVAPGEWLLFSFKLHTELLAEKRKQVHEEKEVAQLRHAQQKIIGKKTVEDFAQLKLMRREPAPTRSRSLHCNGKPSKSLRRSEERELLECNDRVPESSAHLKTRPLLSARLSSPPLASNSLPQRPQSAKPVLQSQYHSALDHTAHLDSDDEETELLDDTMPRVHSSLATKKKRKKKATGRKSGRLSPSKSAPVLPDKAERSQNPPAFKKINIIVNMRNLQLFEEVPVSPSEVAPPRKAWGDQGLSRH